MNISLRGTTVIKLFHFALARRADCGHPQVLFIDRFLFSVQGHTQGSLTKAHTHTRTLLCQHINRRTAGSGIPSVARNTVRTREEEAFKETAEGISVFALPGEHT